jgi:hypothetical protein
MGKVEDSPDWNPGLEFGNTTPDQSLIELLTEIAIAKDEIAMMDAELKGKKSEYYELEEKVFTVMENEDVQKVSVKGRTLYRKIDTYASIVDKEAGYAWLRANDLGAIIKPTVNARTLTATMKEFMAEGGEIDESINITIKRRIGMRRS